MIKSYFFEALLFAGLFFYLHDAEPKPIKMKKQILFLAAGVTIAACSKVESPFPNTNPSDQDLLVNFENGDPIEGQYIVVFKDEAMESTRHLGWKEANDVVAKKTRSLLKSLELNDRPLLFAFGHALQGSVLQLTEKEAEKLASHPQILLVEKDKVIALKGPGGNKPGGGGTTPPPQSTPWGITRVGGAGNGANSGKKAWIIDSGIDLDHPDLNVDVTNSATFVGANSTPDDQHGHGTHVAGTVGAINNSIGVVGVAAGVPVVAVRVLDRRGSGTTSGVIAGVNYVAANASSGDVANMSLGGGASVSLDNAVIAAASTGVKFVVAAGNDAANANSYSPARVNGTNIYTVSAMGTGDIWASFSNYSNPPVDYCAPGVSIASTYKGGGYATMSGTSMAAPHVSGILILGPIVPSGNVIGDPDNTSDIIASR